MYKYSLSLLFVVFIFFQSKGQTYLSVNQSVNYDVFADKASNNSNVFLEAGKTYKITASTNDKWTDDYIETDANGFTSSRGKDKVSREILKLFESKRRVPDANWFCLIGYTIYLVPILGKYTFKIGSTKTLTIPENKGGILYLYANDVNTMYWNNHGKITVTIKRTE